MILPTTVPQTIQNQKQNRIPILIPIPIPIPIRIQVNLAMGKMRRKKKKIRSSEKDNPIADEIKSLNIYADEGGFTCSY